MGMRLTAHQRLASLPNVPTFKELGHPALNEIAITSFGLVAPAKTPAPIVARFNAAVVVAFKDPALLARLKELNAEPIVGSPRAFLRRAPPPEVAPNRHQSVRALQSSY
ncbi:tripartite tricarboxylate transporter substrate-binding protein [Ottowia thiooxydans]|uniref:tripartite tricarboxylate transporter substrate-binding protein n=1 Tax=Ottowia thiooxydans TaxID=219182 RepID=UPI000424030A|nr:tripartite tricarboxylate transporter substrate-binding protein [Ottowia thiooxydans]